MRSKPVVCSSRVSVGTAAGHARRRRSASRARRMPPMSAPRPAESMNGTSDRSMSSRGGGQLGQRLAELARPCRRRAHRRGGTACTSARVLDVDLEHEVLQWAWRRRRRRARSVATGSPASDRPGWPRACARLAAHGSAPRPCPTCCSPPTPTGSSTRSMPPSAATTSTVYRVRAGVGRAARGDRGRARPGHPRPADRQHGRHGHLHVHPPRGGAGRLDHRPC